MEVFSCHLQGVIQQLASTYLYQLSAIAGPLITCGPVLGWLELDNRGHRLIVTDDSDINTPAVAAAYVVKRYVAQASDEISFEVSPPTLSALHFHYANGGSSPTADTKIVK